MHQRHSVPLILLLNCFHAAVAATGPDTTVQSLDTVEVHAPSVKSYRLNVEAGERIIGRTDDLNNLLLLEPGTARIPEAGSRLLVRGDDHTENLYMMMGVPLMTLSHFGGQVAADRSFIPIGTGNSVDCRTTRVAGTYSGASGAVVTVDPDLPTGRRQVPRPELSINYGTLGAECAITVPLHKYRQFYQVVVRPSDIYTMGLDNVLFGRDHYIGFDQPYASTDGVFIGRQITDRMTVDETVWISYDQYATAARAYAEGYGVRWECELESFPWGIAAISFRGDSARLPWEVSAGGSRQYVFDGKRIGRHAPVISVKRDNAAFVAELAAMNLGSGRLRLRVNAGYEEWEGSLTRYDITGYLANFGEGAMIFSQPDDTIGSVVRTADGSGTVALQCGWEQGRGSNSWGLNVSSGLFTAGAKAFVDPGIWFQSAGTLLSFECDAGIVSSQPDIAGLPDGAYAAKVIHTAVVNTGLSYRPSQRFSARLDGYAKYKDHVPVRTPDPLNPVWDPEAGASGLFYGIALTLDAAILERIRFWTSQLVGRSQVFQDGRVSVAGWDIPWMNKSSLSLALVKNYLTLYLNGLFSAGLPYRDIEWHGGSMYRWSEEQHRVPAYKRIDVKLEFRQPIPLWERNMLQFDAYILLENVVNFADYMARAETETWRNVREYYWDDDLRLTPVYLNPFDLHIGFRVRMRF